MIKKISTLLLLFLATPVFACEFGSVSFSADFDGAKLDKCEQLSPSHYLLHSNPENRPINPSPWYSFKVVSKNKQDVVISIVFDGSRPRYLPKISHDGEWWQNIDFEVQDKKLTFSLPLSPGSLWVSAQEVIDNQDYAEWTEQLARSDSIQKIAIGKSAQGREMTALISRANGSKEWMLLLGRQHPPEVTGALAMLPFVDTVLSDSALAKSFRKRFNLLIIPNMNPDGVANGHWRHNTQGIDLNRDWINFSQVETQNAKKQIDRIVEADGKFVFAVDFHSTQEDVFYTMPTDYGLSPATFVDDWLAELNKTAASSFKVRPKPGSSPGRGIFKQYFADTFKTHAITYEMGDNTERAMITHIANQSAKTLMQHALATPPSQFYKKGS